VADYIPELGKANPRHFGVALATIDGHVYEVGDSCIEFTIQSISKAFIFALTLETVDQEQIEACVLGSADVSEGSWSGSCAWRRALSIASKSQLGPI